MVFILIALVVSVPFGSEASPKDILESSPRHHEWVAVKQGDREIQTVVAYPEVSGKALAVIIIHENRGLSDWVRSVADRVAAAGYIAAAPDLLSGMGPGGGKTSDFTDSDAVREALYKLAPEQITADLAAVADYVTGLPAASGKLAIAGFCWGGSQTFRFATDRQGLTAAFVFYGTGPEDAGAYGRITAPVYGFYGGDDARVNQTVPASAEEMKKAGKTYETVTYDGAGHAFMRTGEDESPKEANKKAMEQSWVRWLGILEKL
ncbi:MAG: dienelactone hydrolase family protein [bacterium]|nr:MAG: dienelactone hydrolase family protein [bacterium]